MPQGEKKIYPYLSEKLKQIDFYSTTKMFCMRTKIFLYLRLYSSQSMHSHRE